MRAALLVATVIASACSQPKAYFSEAPIALALAGSGGGLLGQGTALDTTAPFPMLVDTASPISAFSDGTGAAPRADRGSMQLFSDAADGGAERLQIDNIELFVAPFNASGFDVATPIMGVLGGDNLQHFVLGLRYQPSPTLTITNQLVETECDLSERCTTVLPYSLEGGHQLIALGDDIFNYAASYVLLDGCLEPALDPLEPNLNCASTASCSDLAQSCDSIADPTAKASCEETAASCPADAARYMPQGVDIRLAVATGFPGLAITASAFDRLGRPETGEALIAAATHTLFLPEQAGGLPVGVSTLGVPATQVHDGSARAALTLVQNDGFFGACATIARSRRLRRVRPEPEFAVETPTSEATCLRFPPDRPAGDPHNDALDELLISCTKNAGNSSECDDRTQDAHTNAYIDFNGTIPIIVVPDTTSLIQSINADVRPQSATVEAVIGTELLQRAFTTIDYANSRVVITCVDDSCRVFPREGHGTNCSPPVGDQIFGGGNVRNVAGVGCAVTPSL